MTDYELENLRTARNKGTIDTEGLAILNETVPDIPVVMPQWRGEITTDNYIWYTNARRFDTRDEALVYVKDLATRWTWVTRWRAVSDATPERQPYEPGSEDGAW